MGNFLAASQGSFQWPVFLLCISTTVFLQVLSNLANDYGDSQHGADSEDRQGPSRAVQSGAITAEGMKRGMAIATLLALASGISLLYVSLGWNLQGFLFFFLLGLLSIVAAITYTVGRKPYGYAGLGDLSVLIFFGLTGVMGSAYLQMHYIDWPAMLPALSCGIFSVAVLNVNNIRDIESDRKAGKYSIPVRVGRAKAVVYHWVLVSTGILLPVVYTFLNLKSPFQWLFLLTVPLFLKNARGVSRATTAQETDPYLKQMALTTFLYVVLFGVGMLVINH